MSLIMASTISQKYQIIYTEDFTAELVYEQVYLHLYSFVMNHTRKNLMEVIVGEAKVKCGLEQLGTVQDESIQVQTRWKNLKELLDSNFGLRTDTHETFLGILVNLDHLNFKNFSEDVRQHIRKTFKLEIKKVPDSNSSAQSESVATTATQPPTGVVRPIVVTEQRQQNISTETQNDTDGTDGHNLSYYS